MENFFSSWLPFNIDLSLAMGLAIYLSVNKKMGFTVLVAGALWQDVLFNPTLPVTTAAIIISWWLWQRFVDEHLAPLGRVTVLASAASWLALYLISHWLLSWLPFWLGDTPLYPGAAVSPGLLIAGWAANLVLLVGAVLLVSKKVRQPQ